MKLAQVGYFLSCIYYILIFAINYIDWCYLKYKYGLKYIVNFHTLHYALSIK